MSNGTKTIEKAFRPLRRVPCWEVKRGYGSFLTMEFGEPSLDIFMTGRKRRGVYVHGEWHLWIYCCEWAAFEGRKLIGDSSKNKGIDKAAAELNGQMLKNVRAYKNGRTDFRFEYGTLLRTRPYDKDSEQWRLYEPDGDVLSFRADGSISHQPGNTPADEEKWTKI